MVVERETLLALVNHNAALHVRIGEMHLREAELVRMIGDLLNAVDIAAADSNPTTLEEALRSRISRQAANGVLRDLQEMHR